MHFMGLGLGVAVSTLGAMGMQALHFDWADPVVGLRGAGLGIFAAGLGLAVLRCRRRCWPRAIERHRAAGMMAYFCAGWGFVITRPSPSPSSEAALAGSTQGLGLAAGGCVTTPAVFVWDRIARRLGDVNLLLLAYVMQIIGCAAARALGLAGMTALAKTLAGRNATFIGIVA